MFKKLTVFALLAILSGGVSAKNGGPTFVAEGTISELSIEGEYASFTVQGAFIVHNAGEQTRSEEQSIRIQAHVNDPFWSASPKTLNSAGLSQPERAFEILEEAETSKRPLTILLVEPTLVDGAKGLTIEKAAIVKMTDYEF